MSFFRVYNVVGYFKRFMGYVVFGIWGFGVVGEGYVVGVVVIGGGVKEGIGKVV